MSKFGRFVCHSPLVSLLGYIHEASRKQLIDCCVSNRSYPELSKVLSSKVLSSCLAYCQEKPKLSKVLSSCLVYLLPGEARPIKGSFFMPRLSTARRSQTYRRFTFHASPTASNICLSHVYRPGSFNSFFPKSSGKIVTFGIAMDQTFSYGTTNCVLPALSI